MIHHKLPGIWKSALAAGTLMSLSGCVYGAGYYGDGYVNNSYDSSGYSCDPFAPFDDYYACDYGYGFANIGFGGGWYDHYYYPGYGVFLFDRGGQRYAMRDHHRRHWARQRALYGGHYGRRHHHNGERHAERRDHGADRPDRGSHQQPDLYRNHDRTSEGRRHSGTTETTRSDRRNSATPGGSRGNRADRVRRRPTMAVQQPQARPAPAIVPPQAKREQPSSKIEPGGHRRERDD